MSGLLWPIDHSECTKRSASTLSEAALPNDSREGTRELLAGAFLLGIWLVLNALAIGIGYIKFALRIHKVQQFVHPLPYSAPPIHNFRMANTSYDPHYQEASYLMQHVSRRTSFLLIAILCPIDSVYVRQPQCSWARANHSST